MRIKKYQVCFIQSNTCIDHQEYDYTRILGTRILGTEGTKISKMLSLPSGLSEPKAQIRRDGISPIISISYSLC